MLRNVDTVVLDLWFSSWKSNDLPSEASFPCLPASSPRMKVSIITASLFMPWIRMSSNSPISLVQNIASPVICSKWPTGPHHLGWCHPDKEREVSKWEWKKQRHVKYFLVWNCSHLNVSKNFNFNIGFHSVVFPCVHLSTIFSRVLLFSHLTLLIIHSSSFHLFAQPPLTYQVSLLYSSLTPSPSFFPPLSLFPPLVFFAPPLSLLLRSLLCAPQLSLYPSSLAFLFVLKLTS